MDYLSQRNQSVFPTVGLIACGVVMLVAGGLSDNQTFLTFINPDSVFSDGWLDRAFLGKVLHWGILGLGLTILAAAIGAFITGRLGRKDAGASKERIVLRVFRPRVIVGVVFLLLSLILLNKTVRFALSDKWKPVTGYEYYWIAESLAGGHGFSLPADHRWFFYDFKSEYPSDKYYPTALEEPAYPALLAFAFRFLGERGHLAVLLFNMVALYMTSLVMYFLARKIFDSRLGILASVALPTWWWYEISWLTLGVFSPAILGGLVITSSAYLAVWSLEKVSVKRAVLLGAMLAVCCLTLSAGMLLVPLSVLATLFLKRPFRPFAWRPALAIIVTVGAILSPWTLRNYLVFGQLIPVRTGFGLALHQSNPILAATFSTGSHACTEELGPMWRAEDAKDAIRQVRKDQSKRMAMYKRGYECIERKAPAGYETFNEAQRDKVYLEKSLEFIRSHPRLFVEMTRHRVQAFLVGWNSRHTLVALLAIVGALLAWRNRNALLVVAMVAAYTFTFSFATPLMYRYRYPIEPILFVLAAGIPAILVSKARSMLRKEG